MLMHQDFEPVTTESLMRRATVLLVRANELQVESDLLKRQTEELLRTARQLDAEAQGRSRPTTLQPLAEATAAEAYRRVGDVLNHVGEVLTHPRHLFRHAR
jgi:hypothetical protein